MRSARTMVAALLLCLLAACTTSRVDVASSQLRVGIQVRAYPELVLVPDYPVYYAPGLDANYFFYDDLFWVFVEERWYSGTWYNGPWTHVVADYVPVYVLSVPVYYYRRPPAYFHAWRSSEAPRWGERWGREWEARHPGWNQRPADARPAPRPDYQRRYSGSRYPRPEQQRRLHGQYYSHRPRDVVAHPPHPSPAQRREQAQEQRREPGEAARREAQQERREAQQERREERREAREQGPWQQQEPREQGPQQGQEQGERGRQDAHDLRQQQRREAWSRRRDQPGQHPGQESGQEPQRSPGQEPRREQAQDWRRAQEEGRPPQAQQPSRQPSRQDWQGRRRERVPERRDEAREGRPAPQEVQGQRQHPPQRAPAPVAAQEPGNAPQGRAGHGPLPAPRRAPEMQRSDTRVSRPSSPSRETAAGRKGRAEKTERQEEEAEPQGGAAGER